MYLSMKQYQKAAMRTSPRDGHDKIDNGVLGLIGETGELVDVLKKYYYQSGLNPKLPAEKIADELGDVLWYLAELADGMDMQLIDIAEDDFRDLDRITERKSRRRLNLRNAIMGLSERAQRICWAVTRYRLKDTAGHMRYMLKVAAHLAHLAGFTLEQVAQMNINKLKKRYPDGFDAKKSMERYE